MNVAIIGAGRQGARRAKAIHEFGDKATYIVDSNVSLARSLAEQYNSHPLRDWHETIYDRTVDAVVVCTPNNLHSEISIAALKAGKYVLCEKPLARNPDEALEVLKVTRQSKGRLKCGFNLRYHPAISRAKKLVGLGSIGRVLFLRCLYGMTGRSGYEKDWRANLSIAGGGELMDQGVHVLDLFRWFAGDFHQVCGYTATMYWDIKPAEDNAFAMLRNKSGQVGLFHASWTEWKNRFSFEVFGENGYTRVTGLGGSYGNEHLAIGRRDFRSPFREDVTEFRGEDKSWLEEWRDFSVCIKENRKFQADAYDGWAAVRLANAIYESSRKLKTVSLAW